MGPFIARHRERPVDHDEPAPTTIHHLAEPWDCGWSSYPYGGQTAMRLWRAHRAAATIEILDW